MSTLRAKLHQKFRKTTADPQFSTNMLDPKVHVTQPKQNKKSLTLLNNQSDISSNNNSSSDESSSNDKVSRLQTQVVDLHSIAVGNVQKLMVRREHLDQLVARADALESNAQVHVRLAGRLRRQKYWENTKWGVIVGVLCVIALMIVAVYSYWWNTQSNTIIDQ